MHRTTFHLLEVLFRTLAENLCIELISRSFILCAQGVDDALLMHFLKGFSLNIDEAAKAFPNHQEWEASFKPKGFISEIEIPNELNAKKSYMQGRDKQVRPLCVILARNHVYNKEDFDEFCRMYFAYMRHTTSSFCAE